MNLLINASNIKKSGALSVTFSFLQEIKSHSTHQFSVIISNVVEKQIDKSSFGENFTFFSLSLVKPFSKGYKEYKKELNEIERKVQPDCVFSMFAPTYWTPSSPHIAGFAYPWAINLDSEFIKRLSLKDKIILKLENVFKSYFFRRDAQYYITETADVKRRLEKYIGIKAKNIFVVSSTYSSYFNNENFKDFFLSPKQNENEFRFITIASNFAHKNLAIIAKISDLLIARGYYNVFFYVTLEKEDYQNLYSNNNAKIVNIGTFNAEYTPSLYSHCDALFLPTLLECFSATYPEAMKMCKPILTSNLDFAHDVCGNAALYFNPFSVEDIVNKIEILMNDKNVYNNLISKGLNRVKDFPTARQRADKYLEICKEIITR